MEQRKIQQNLKEEKTMDILSRDAMRFIKGGDGDPPPVENNSGEGG